MVSLLLTSAVAASSLTGFSLFAASLAAATIGNFIDSKLFPTNISQEGPRLESINLSTSSEGQPVKRLFGTSRLGGNMIWVTNFREVSTTTTQSVGGKGGGGDTISNIEYTYFVSVAFAFCEGNPRASLGRIWVDNRLMETSGIIYRFYPGSETQTVDPKILQIEGVESASAFRGIAYIVFEELDLTEFGNRIPMITAEINVPVYDLSADLLENLIQSVNLIPSTGEQAYATTPTVTLIDDQVSFSNSNLSADKTDFVWSMENLKSQMPNVTSLNLVISWFGDDLRLGSGTTKPKVEFGPSVSSNYVSGIKGLIDSDYGFTQSTDDTWTVNGLNRNNADVVSRDALDNPNFGGTPADWSVTEAILYTIDTAGLDVHFYPFILMDIVAGNTLPNTDGVTTGQPIFPWRGRITVSAPSVDKMAAAGTEMDAYMGSVTRTQFSNTGTRITYSGAAGDWGYRRFIFFYAHLCAAAAAVSVTPTRFKTFYIGTELVGINRVRNNAGVYVGTAALVSILNDVRLIFDSYGMTHVELSYAADWSEYHSHRPEDASGDVLFPLDAIWSNADCDHIGIDNYTPISDWRDGTSHLDFGVGNDVYGNPRARYIYDQSYLKGQIEGGELFDYFYASSADRASQTRTPIQDLAHSEHWIFRQKDMRNWWSNTHHPRPLGVRAASPSSWVASSKRIRFSEFGVPTIDKGTNQPNVFFDPKSSESFVPYFSNGNRDDQIQRSYYEAMITYWRDNSPTSPIRMIASAEMCAWAWDARPYPAFPYRSDFWSDSPNWTFGHWLNGRAGSVPLAELVKMICSWVGFTAADLDVTELIGRNSIVRGYVIDNQSSPRASLDPLFSAYLFDGFESQGKMKFVLREYTTFEEIDVQDLVSQGGAKSSGYQITRAQETEMPQNSSVSFINPADDYQVATATGSRQTTTSKTSVDMRYPLVFETGSAKMLAEIMIQQAWAARESIELALSNDRIKYDPGDGFSITIGNRLKKFRFSGISKGDYLEIDGNGMDVSIYDAVSSNYGSNTTSILSTIGSTNLYFMDLPLVTGDEPRPWAPRVAAFQTPFPRSVDIYEVTNNGADLSFNNSILVPSQMGILSAALQIGPHEIIDEGNVLSIDLRSTSFQILSETEENVRNGANAIAILTPSGNWEILKFVNSSFVSGARYDLTRLFRGQLGTWPIMEVIPIGSPFVILNPAGTNVLSIAAERKLDAITWRYGPNVYGTASPFFRTQTHTGKAVGELPYPVADVQFFKTAAADVLITWRRQTRFNGEGFDAAIVPLNEDDERYEIDLLTSLDVLITTVTTTVASYSYVGAPANFKARIHQMSTNIGRGRPVTKQSPF